MPENTRTIRSQEMDAGHRPTTGDVAVDGLLAGVIAGGVMAGYLVLSGLLAGIEPLQTLARFASPAGASVLAGILVHLSLSAVYGIVFGVIYRLLGGGRLAGRGAGTLLGLGYGLVLLLLAQGVTLALPNAPLRAVPAGHLAVAHGIYGAVLGWLMAQRG